MAREIEADRAELVLQALDGCPGADRFELEHDRHGIRFHAAEHVALSELFVLGSATGFAQHLIHVGVYERAIALEDIEGPTGCQCFEAALVQSLGIEARCEVGE